MLRAGLVHKIDNRKLGSVTPIKLTSTIQNNGVPYFQAKELVDLQSTDVEALLDALEDLYKEYAHIIGTVHSGMRDNAEEDLIRIIILSKTIKHRIIQINKK